MLAYHDAAEEAGARHDEGRQDQRQRGQLRPRPPGQHGIELVVVIERARQHVEIVAVTERARQLVEQIAGVVAVTGLFFWL